MANVKVAVQAGQAGPNKRGHEGALDMVRSLSLVLLVVVAIWFFAQPPDGDEQALRPIDPAGDISAFATDEPAVPVPSVVPGQWQATSSSRTADPRGLRVGYVTTSRQYAEYAASTEPAAVFLPAITGDGRELEAVDVDGDSWAQYRDADGSVSLARTYGPVTVVVGTTRGTAALDELRVLVRSLRAG